MKPSVTAVEHDGRTKGGGRGEVGRLRLGLRQSGGDGGEWVNSACGVVVG